MHVSNAGATADLSLYRLDGDITFTFPPGTVLPAGESLYLSPDLVAFRARPTSPRADERLFLVGPWSGALTAAATVRLRDPSGALLFAH